MKIDVAVRTNPKARVMTALVEIPQHAVDEGLDRPGLCGRSGVGIQRHERHEAADEGQQSHGGDPVPRRRRPRLDPASGPAHDRAAQKGESSGEQLDEPRTG